MEDVGIFYGHLVFCNILWTFGIVRGNSVHFSRFGILYQEKSGNPALDQNSECETNFERTALIVP
jgi:hypothetical protein